MTDFAALICYSGEIGENDYYRTLLPAPENYAVEDLSFCTPDPNKTNTDDFTSAPHKILWEYWQKLRGDGEIARYTQINPMDFNKAIGFVMLLEPNSDLSDFKYRVYGSSIVAEIGSEMTGKQLTDFHDPREGLTLDQYPAVVKTRRPLYSEHNSSYHENTLVRWCRLILPMENSQGEVDRILVGCAPKRITPKYQ